MSDKAQSVLDHNQLVLISTDIDHEHYDLRDESGQTQRFKYVSQQVLVDADNPDNLKIIRTYQKDDSANNLADKPTNKPAFLDTKNSTCMRAILNLAYNYDNKSNFTKKRSDEELKEYLEKSSNIRLIQSHLQKAATWANRLNKDGLGPASVWGVFVFLCLRNNYTYGLHDRVQMLDGFLNYIWYLSADKNVHSVRNNANNACAILVRLLQLKKDELNRNRTAMLFWIVSLWNVYSNGTEFNADILKKYPKPNFQLPKIS